LWMMMKKTWLTAAALAALFASPALAQDQRPRERGQGHYERGGAQPAPTPPAPPPAAQPQAAQPQAPQPQQAQPPQAQGRGNFDRGRDRNAGPANSQARAPQRGDNR